jgi:catechol 2,3-dioxygenase-like lactoylglutathione lyase family enzyme
MKRFHVHAHVDDLQASIAFYTRLFGAEPTRVESDYAKWMIDDPRLNFAISTRGTSAGIDHLGIQADSDEELAELRQRAQAADAGLLDEGATTCCYARSDKHWVTDPQGIAWEHYRTLGDIPVFREATQNASAAACCSPAAAAAATTASCCAPQQDAQAAASCSPDPDSRGSACCTPAAQARPGRCC